MKSEGNNNLNYQNTIKSLDNPAVLPQVKIKALVALYQLHNALSESKKAIDHLKEAVSCYQKNPNDIDTKFVHQILTQLIYDLIYNHNQMSSANKKEIISYIEMGLQVAPNDPQLIKLHYDLNSQGSQLPNTSINDQNISASASANYSSNDTTAERLAAEKAEGVVTVTDDLLPNGGANVTINTTNAGINTFCLKNVSVKNLATLATSAVGIVVVSGTYCYLNHHSSACDALSEDGISVKFFEHLVSCIGECLWE